MLRSSIATVTGPTPPGTGVRYPATSLAESKSTSLLGGVKSTLPDEDEEAGRQRNVPKLDAPTDPDDPLSGLWSDSDDKPS